MPEKNKREPTDEAPKKATKPEKREDREAKRQPRVDRGSSYAPTKVVRLGLVLFASLGALTGCPSTAKAPTPEATSGATDSHDEVESGSGTEGQGGAE